MTWLAAAVPWLRPDLFGGVPVLRAIQTVHGPFLDRFFIAVTMLGSEEFYLVAIPLIYWCFDRELGRRLGRLLLFSSFVNVWAKGLVHTPRPPHNRVRVLFPQSAGGFAFPSGHTQGTATFFGYLAARSRRRSVSFLAVAAVVLVGLSRLYLGVHWPVDVVGGAALGFLAAYAWQRTGDWWEAQCNLFAWPVRVIGGTIFPLFLLLFYRSPDAVKLVGALAGFSGSAALAKEWLHPLRREGWGHQVLKVLLGVAGLFVLRSGLKSILPVGALYDGLRYGVLGWWAGWLVPWLADEFLLMPEGRRR